MNQNRFILINLFLFITTIFHYTTSSEPLIVLYERDGNCYSTLITFNQINKSLHCKLDMSMQHIFIQKQNFYANPYPDSEDESILTSINLNSPSTCQIESFNLSLASNSHSLDTCGFSLKYSDEDMSMNLLYQLYDMNLIQTKSFTFDIYNDEERAHKLYLGGKIPEINLINKTKLELNVINNTYSRNWGLNLTSFSIDGYKQKYMNNYYSYINVANDRIFVPKDVIEYLKDGPFKKYLDNKICDFLNNSNYNLYFNCNCELIWKSFPDTYFDFGTKRFVFDNKHMFIPVKNGEKCLYLLQHQNRDFFEDEWFIGSYFIRKFMVEFNYDTRVITFYGNENMLMNIKEINIEKKYLIYAEIFIMLIGCLFLGYMFYLNKII